MPEAGRQIACELPDDYFTTRPKLLMVEDDDTLLELYEAVLSSEYELMMAHTIGAAQVLLRGQPVDAVACDFNLKDAKGLDLLLWIQENKPDLLQHSIILSGEFSPDLGNFHVPLLRKPFTPANLKQAIKALLEPVAGETS